MTATHPVVTAREAVAQAQDLDTVAFRALTPRDVYRRVRAAPRGEKLRALAANLGGFLSNWGIALLQLASNPLRWRDGKWLDVHHGIVRIPPEIERAGNFAWLYQSTFPRGVHRVPLEDYLAQYPQAKLLHVRPPLSIDDGYDAAARYLDECLGLPYNWKGLLSVLTDGSISDPAGKFCSQLDAGAYQAAGALPRFETHYDLRTGLPRRTGVADGWWAPVELEREDGLLDHDTVIIVRGDLWTT